MPTRIVLDVSEKRLTSTQPSNTHFFNEKSSFFRGRREHNSSTGLGSQARSDQPLVEERYSVAQASSRRILSLRSSIFRDSEVAQKAERGLSTSDIRASPRLIGYIYQLLASIVLLISVTKFYRISEDETFLNIDTQSLKENFGAEILSTVAGPVYLWKLIASAVVGSVGAGMALIIVLVHFDTICLPRLWVMFFRDGSSWEQTLLRFMVLFWAVSLHVCTSSLSVGEIQGNVFFTTWIAFAASVLNYGVWRKSAGLSSLAEIASLHHRETTYNWLWLSFCMSIFAGAATDVYFNRDELNLRFTPDGTDLSDEDWQIVLVIVWSFLALGVSSIMLNHYCNRPILVVSMSRRNSRVVLGWRHFEGLVIIIMVGVFFFLLIRYSGVDGALNGLTNAYFSLWGAFFNSVFLLGTWLRENKNIEYYVEGGAVDDETTAERGVTFERQA